MITPDTISGDAAAVPCNATIPIASLTAPNTSANPTYDRAHFPANFGTSTWISQAGAMMAVDPDRMDLSLNPITPGHVSAKNVHTLIPSRPDLRWFAHSVPWFGPNNHIQIGIDSNTDAYIAAMIEDMKRRGFDGVVVNWYGQGSIEDQATLRIRDYLKSDPSFKLILMLDKGISNLSQSVLQQQLAYCDQQYFHEASYELEGGKPIVMFFGVEAVVGAPGMAAVKAQVDQIWVEEGASTLSKSYVDQAFDWTHDYHDGPSAADPYNLAAVRDYYSAVAGSSKHAFGSMVAGFNGMLTKTVAWSMGKYLPRDNGECVVQWAHAIDQVIPANVTRMQWATWSDWEEGTAIEPGVENNVAITLDSSLHVTLTGDASTVDHVELYGTTDGVMAEALGTTPPAATGCTSALAVAVGKPVIRDHVSNVVSLPTP